MLKNKTPLTLKIIIILSLFLLTACTTQVQELSFETLSRNTNSGYKDRRPGLMVITNIEETKHLGRWFHPNDRKLALDVDYTHYFVVIVFRGWYGRAHEGIKVERIAQQGNNISVFTWMGKGQGDTVITSHFHMVKVEKMGNLANIDTYTLIVNGEAEAIIEQASARNTPIPPSFSTAPFTSSVTLPLMSSPLKPLLPTSTRPPRHTPRPTDTIPVRPTSDPNIEDWRDKDGGWRGFIHNY